MSTPDPKSILNDVRDAFQTGAQAIQSRTLDLREQAIKEWSRMKRRRNERQMEKNLAEEYEALGRLMENVSQRANLPDNIFAIGDVHSILQRIAEIKQELLASQQTEETEAAQAAAQPAAPEPVKKPSVKKAAASAKPAAKKTPAAKSETAAKKAAKPAASAAKKQAPAKKPAAKKAPAKSEQGQEQA